MENTYTIPDQEIYICFSGITEILALKILKPGFRHCFAIIKDKGKWVIYDPMLNYTEIKTVPDIPENFDLPGWHKCRGLTVTKATRNTGIKWHNPLQIMTCVGAIKRLLAIHNPMIITPHQLFKHLIKKERNNSKWVH